MPLNQKPAVIYRKDAKYAKKFNYLEDKDLKQSGENCLLDKCLILLRALSVFAVQMFFLGYTIIFAKSIHSEMRAGP